MNTKPFRFMLIFVSALACCISCDAQREAECIEIKNGMECISIQQNRKDISRLLESRITKLGEQANEALEDKQAIQHYKNMRGIVRDEIDRINGCASGISEVARSEIAVRGFDQYLFDLGMLDAALGSMYFDDRFMGDKETIKFLREQIGELAKMKSLGKSMCLFDY